MTTAKKYWLLKSEPSVYSIDHLRKEKSAWWEGVRNFQARNHMREMKLGDRAFFYHSNIARMSIGIVGIAEVCKEAYPDHTQFDKKSKYYDRRATKEKPYWYMVDIKFVEKFDEVLTLAAMQKRKELKGMSLLKRGQRLSVQHVTTKEWNFICKLAGSMKKKY